MKGLWTVIAAGIFLTLGGAIFVNAINSERDNMSKWGRVTEAPDASVISGFFEDNNE